MGYKKFLIILFIFCLLIGLALSKKAPSKDTFTFWTIQLKAPYGDIIQKNIEIFKEKHPEIEVVWVDIPITEAQKRAIASILGGNPPDLINLNPEFSSLLAQKNTLEYFSEDEVEPYNKSLTDKLKYEGKIYGIPFYATSAVTILNKDKFKNCDVKLKTYDDILKLKKCKNTPVFGMALNEGDAFSKILNKYGVSKENFSQDEIYKIYKLFYKMKNENLLLKDTLTINHRENVEKYMAQASDFTILGSNFINMIKENAPSIYENSTVIPQLTGSTGGYDVSIMNFVIPKNAKHKDLAREFIKLVLDDKNQLILAQKTNVLPVNKKTLNNPYLKNCSNDLTDKARCISVKQLNNPSNLDFGVKNKKEINEVINKSLETLFLKGEAQFSPDKINEDIKTLIEN